MKKLIVALVLVGCDVYVEPTECEIPEPAEPIRLPEQCWEEPDCVTETAADTACGRAYVCNIEQPDGRFEPVCVTARDCDCLETFREECGGPVYMPGYCSFEEGASP